MLSLLRQLRRLELHKRSRRYFLYAAGEIVLIVVGILIALQINDWTQERTDRRLERNFLHRFSTDLDEDLRTLKQEVENELLGVEALKEAVQLIQRENVEEDIYTFNELYDEAWVYFTPQRSTYEELESTGQLNLIRDEGLRLAIQKHYAFYEEMEWESQHMFTWRKSITHGFDSQTSILKYANFNRSIFPPEQRSQRDWEFINDPEDPKYLLAETATAATGYWLGYFLDLYEDIIHRTEALKAQIDAALVSTD